MADKRVGEKSRRWLQQVAHASLASLLVLACGQVPGGSDSDDGVARVSQRVEVSAARPVSALSLASASVVGGGTMTGSVTLLGTSGTTAVALSVDLPGIVQVPASIQVASGTTASAFTIVTSPVSAATTVRITATAGGSSAFTDLLLLPTTATTGASAVIDDPGCRANTLARNDDGSTGAVTLPSPVNFFGTTYTFFYINNNGNVTFRQPMSTYTPFTITASTPPIIAPFFADVDTQGSGSSPVTYSFGAVQFAGRPAMCVDWVNVGYFASHFDKLNSFQLLLVDRSDVHAGDFDIVMNYDRIAWETGDASGGVNGFGGTPAGAGYSAGTGVASQFYQFPGSLTASALLDSNATTGLTRTSRNTLTLGRHIFEVRNGAAPAGGGIGGRVSNAAATPLAGAPVQACRVSDGRCVYVTLTSSLGQYEATGLPEGDYTVTAFPPAGSSLFARTSAPVHVTPGAVVRLDITLAGPTPPPAGVSITPSTSPSGGIPVVYWNTPLQLRASACNGGSSSYTITGSDSSLFASGSLSETAPGQFSATVPPFYPKHGQAHVHIVTRCPSGPDQTVDFDIYIDPSGLVRTVQGVPVVGAVVTLFRSDSEAGPFVAVPDGSAAMSPMNRSNPMVTDSIGHFGWDVISGFYKVRAQADGCTAPNGDAFVETSVLPVPPAITDLDLRLNCPDVTAPVTTAVLSGAPNAAGWYQASPVISLAAVDESGGSGVASIGYRLSGAQTGTFNVVGAAAQFTLVADGTTTVSYFASDVAGNAESAKALSVSVDSSAPTITCSASPASITSTTQGPVPVHVTVTASDATSGIARVLLTAIDAEGLVPSDVQGFTLGQPSTDGSLRAGPDGRVYLLTYTASDLAGNTASCTASVTVLPPVTTTDTVPPTCAVSKLGTASNGARWIEFSVSDAGSGLSAVRASAIRGGTLAVPTFAKGVTSPIVVRATETASSKTESVTLEISDVTGNKTQCAATLLSLSAKSRTASVSDVLASQGTLTVYNGKPGAKELDATINGKRSTFSGLKDGQTKSFDISSSLKSGAGNCITLTLDACNNAAMDVLLWKGPVSTAAPTHS